MAISKNKIRIAITITEKQNKEFEEIATKLGITKSILMQIATIEYIKKYKK